MLDTLLSGQLLFAAAVLGVLYAVIGIGLNLVYGTMRLLNIAHGDILMLGAYAAFWWFSLTGLSPLLTLPLVAVLAAGIGIGLYLAFFKKHLSSGAHVAEVEARSLLVFFGISVVIQNAVAWAFTSTPRAYRYLDGVWQLGDTAMTGNRVAALVLGIAILIGILMFLNRTLFGLEIKALIQHREAARIVGINVERVQLFAIGLGFAVAGVAGVLVSMTEQVTPFMGFPFTIGAFVVIIMGGLGNIRGGIIAGFVLAFVEIYLVTLTSANMRSILVYGIFVAVLLIRPQGLLARAKRS